MKVLKGRRAGVSRQQLVLRKMWKLGKNQRVTAFRIKAEGEVLAPQPVGRRRSRGHHLGVRTQNIIQMSIRQFTHAEMNDLC